MSESQKAQCQQQQRNCWPELVKLPWKEAEDKIRHMYPNMSVQVLPENSMVTMDYREDRVRIFTDKDGKVALTPMIG